MTEDEGLTKTEDASAEDDDYDFFGETTEDEEGEAEEDTGNCEFSFQVQGFGATL